MKDYTWGISMDNHSTEEKIYELKPYGIILLGVVGFILQVYTGNTAKFAAFICYISSLLLITMGIKILVWRSSSRLVSNRPQVKKKY
jgi:hypothetical protein